MKRKSKRCPVYSISTMMAIYNSIEYPYGIIGIPKLSKEQEKIYTEEKKQMISKIVNFISNYHSKIKSSDFDLNILNPRYLTKANLKLIEELLDKGLPVEDVKAFILEVFPQEIGNQYVDREEIINKNRERSLYLKQKFNKSIKED